MIEDLRTERLHERISGTWGRSLEVLESTASTMDVAAAAAANGAADGHLVLADQQTQGRGAHGRHWVSPPGSDLYFSVVARPAVEPASTALVTLASGLGVRDAVAGLLPERSVRVKWPNDIWIGRRKCAGVLVESRTLGMRIDSVIIGVGLNVNRIAMASRLGRYRHVPAGGARRRRALRPGRSSCRGPLEHGALGEAIHSRRRTGRGECPSIAARAPRRTSSMGGWGGLVRRHR